MEKLTSLATGILVTLSSIAYCQENSLVDINDIDSSIRVDIHYATTNNFTGKILTGYEANRCFLLPQTAEKLHNAQNELKEKGLSIIVYDCYRPVSATEEMVNWAKESGNEKLLGVYISSRSKHNTGNTIDLAVIDVLTGKQLDLGKYDEFSEKAWTRNSTSEEQKANRQMLKNILEKHGLTNYWREWWHFQDNEVDATERFNFPIKN